jgi:hypothetical protein
MGVARAVANDSFGEGELATSSDPTQSEGWCGRYEHWLLAVGLLLRWMDGQWLTADGTGETRQKGGGISET